MSPNFKCLQVADEKSVHHFFRVCQICVQCFAMHQQLQSTAETMHTTHPKCQDCCGSVDKLDNGGKERMKKKADAFVQEAHLNPHEHFGRLANELSPACCLA